MADDLLGHIIDIKTAVGRIEGKQDEMGKHIASVSTKADNIRVELKKEIIDHSKEDSERHGDFLEALSAHKDSDDAHGLKAERRGAIGVKDWLMFGVAIVGIIAGIAGWKK